MDVGGGEGWVWWWGWGGGGRREGGGGDEGGSFWARIDNQGDPPGKGPFDTVSGKKSLSGVGGGTPQTRFEAILGGGTPPPPIGSFFAYFDPPPSKISLWGSIFAIRGQFFAIRGGVPSKFTPEVHFFNGLGKVYGGLTIFITVW